MAGQNVDKTGNVVMVTSSWSHLSYIALSCLTDFSVRNLGSTTKMTRVLSSFLKTSHCTLR